jgi:hypothetical protein
VRRRAGSAERYPALLETTYNLPATDIATGPHATRKFMKFETWIAEIEAVVTFDVDAELWRKYFDAGLTPLQAIEQNRIDEEV